jgi:putative ABC transport system substrate-binding protein
MRRREFITLLGGAAAWPLASRAQQPTQMKRLGVLMNLAADDLEGQIRFAAFLQGMQEVGWAVGRNLRIDIRWGLGDVTRLRKQAVELVSLAPDAILAQGSSTVRPLLEATRNIPIVFPASSDPLGAGFVDSLARPGGNATGFMSFEYSISGKWLEVLKEAAPTMTRVAVLRDASQGSGTSMYAIIQALASSLRIEVNPINIGSAEEIERAIASFTRVANGGLIVTTAGSIDMHRDSIVASAARHKLPAVYPVRNYVVAGGLISYGIDYVDQYRRAAGYVDRIFKGEKPADLPVQAPTKYELVINLKTAKTLGLAVPPTLLATADEVIE